MSQQGAGDLAFGLLLEDELHAVQGIPDYPFAEGEVPAP